MALVSLFLQGRERVREKAKVSFVGRLTAAALSRFYIIKVVYQYHRFGDTSDFKVTLVCSHCPTPRPIKKGCIELCGGVHNGERQPSTQIPIGFRVHLSVSVSVFVS